MEAVTITQITPSELQHLIESSIQKILSSQKEVEHTNQDELLTVEQAATFLSLSKPTIYGLISKGELPVMKRSKRCYFSKKELIAYLKDGRRKTNKEIEKLADNYTKGG